MEKVERDFESLVRDTYVPLLEYTLRRIPDRAGAEDVVSEAYLIAWKRWEASGNGQVGLLWLYGTAWRLISHERRNWARGKAAFARLPQALPVVSVEEEVVARNATASVLTALEELDEDDRELLRLAAWEELSRAQLAQVFDCTESAVSMRLHRARDRLRRSYESTHQGNQQTSQAEGNRGARNEFLSN